MPYVLEFLIRKQGTDGGLVFHSSGRKKNFTRLMSKGWEGTQQLKTVC